MKLILPAVFLCIISSVSYATEINVELGGVNNPYNRVAIPGDDGTQFQLAKAFRSTDFYHRLSLSHKFNRHGVRFLYAPLKLNGSATFSKNIDFMGQNYVSGQKIDAEYQFNSYRASWFYQIDDEGPWQTRIGATAKVRDAKTKLSQGSVSKLKRNSGLVPLFYLYSAYEWSNGFRMALDFDGLIAPQGRAFDAALMVGYSVLKNLDLNVGYRMLEGGVDNDTVYNFSRFQYAFTSLTWEF